MTGAFSVPHEVDEQYASIGTVRRLFAKLIPPEAERPPGAQLVRGQADDIRAFSWPRNKLEVVRPNFFERQLSRNHGRPTS